MGTSFLLRGGPEHLSFRRAPQIRGKRVGSGFTVVIAAVYVLVNLLVDLSYAYLDPRIRIE